MHLIKKFATRKIMTAGAVLALPVGLAAGILLPGAMTASAHGITYTPITCTDLNGTSSVVDFTAGNTQPGLSGQGETYIGATAVSKSTVSDTDFSSTGTPTDCSGGVASSGPNMTVSGSLGNLTIPSKASKTYVTEDCSGFTSGASDLKKLALSIPTSLGTVTFTISSASALYYTNPATTDDPTGGDEVGFSFTGKAEITGNSGTKDSSASGTVWLTPAFGSAIASCIASPGTYVGAITTADVDPQDSTLSF